MLILKEGDKGPCSRKKTSIYSHRGLNRPPPHRQQGTKTHWKGACPKEGHMTCPALESSAQERPGSVTEGPNEGHKDHKRASPPLLWIKAERVRIVHRHLLTAFQYLKRICRNDGDRLFNRVIRQEVMVLIWKRVDLDKMHGKNVGGETLEQVSQRWQMPHPWKYSWTGWMGLWPTWSSERCLCPWQGAWTRWLSMVPSNKKILWFSPFLGVPVTLHLMRINFKFKQVCAPRTDIYFSGGLERSSLPVIVITACHSSQTVSSSVWNSLFLGK